jgi:hypothetical protein
MNTLARSAEEYYDRGVLSLEGFQGQGGFVFDLKVTTPSTPLVAEFDPSNEIGQAIGAKITELYDSVEAHEVTVDGVTKVIEAGIIRGVGDRTRLHGATYSSSLVANKGNGFEEARSAVFAPDTTHLYIGAPGIGLTSPLTPEEEKFLKRWGSFIDTSAGDVTVLPYVQAIHEVTRRLGVKVTDLHSDSLGALTTVAYGAVYGKGNIQTSHQNVRPGIKDIGPFALAYGMLYLDGVRSKRHAEVSTDALKMGSDKLQLVEASLSEAFKARILEPRKSGRTLVADLVGLGRGPMHGDPLVVDNIALVKANPDAKVLLTVGSEDPLAKSPKLDERLRTIVGLISTHTKAPVYAIPFEGLSHNIQTHYPQQLDAVSRYLLGR